MRRRSVISADSWQPEDSIARSFGKPPAENLTSSAKQVKLELFAFALWIRRNMPVQRPEKRLDFCLRQF
jgi:hypothetical protein